MKIKSAMHGNASDKKRLLSQFYITVSDNEQNKIVFGCDIW